MHHNSSPGYALLVGVMIVTAVLLALGLGLNERIRTIDVDREYLTMRIEAHALAYSCLEEGLLRFNRDSSFRNANLNIGSGLCTITVSTSSGGATLSAVGKIGASSRTLYLDCITQAGRCVPSQYREEY